ncbi:MAG: helix-hairpin-helix domain-containing protein [Verrucomicrobia bacterium]|nr:helix-hairpin-helix domain-containing protein [Verrucomicrobiota bacterium]
METIIRRLIQSLTTRLVSRVVVLIIASVLAFFGLKNCGQSESREQIAQRSTKIINVNTASVDDLTLLPRVNEALARRIIAGRPYAKVDDLLKIVGIGPKTLEALRPRVSVEPAK